MKRTLAIARLTFQEGIRMRIVVVLIVLLVFVVLRMPFALRGDETLSGRLQTFLSYSLGALSAFLCLATAFLSCATLCNEIRTRTMHLVVTKPVQRFQILVGKWVGVNLLNVLILVFAGAVIYGFAVFIKNQPAAFEQDRKKVEDAVWTARLAAGPTEPDFREAAEQAVDEMIQRGEAVIQDRDQAVQEKIKEYREQWLQVPPGESRIYEFANLAPPEREDTAYQIRFEVRGLPLPPNEELPIVWIVRHPETGAVLGMRETRERVEQVHYFLVRGEVVVDGRAVLEIANPPDPNPRHRSTIYFQGTDALQILYKVGGFESNYLKTLLLILFRLAFISAVGLLFATFTTFPVACFCTLGVYLLCFGMPWWLHSVGADTAVKMVQNDPFGAFGPIVARMLAWIVLLLLAMLLRLVAADRIVWIGAIAAAGGLELLNLAAPIYTGWTVTGVLGSTLVYALPNFVAYDGVGNLIEGRLVAAGLMLKAAAHTLIYGTVLLVLPGWLVFRAREIAGVTV